jgi:hypothetical protein
VVPDGSQALSRLPSNGTNYTATFTLTNSGDGTGAFGLKAFGRPGTALNILSVAGIAGDTTTVTLAASASVSVPVVYSVGPVAAGTADTVFLRGAAEINQAVDSGYVDLQVVRPSLALVRSVSPPGSVAAGAELAYVIDLTNHGTDAAADVIHVESLATDLEFKVGSESHTLPSGSSVTVEYTSDGGSSWTHIPVSGGCGAPADHDSCITHIRWTLLTDLGPVPPENAVRFEFIARVR